MASVTRRCTDKVAFSLALFLATLLSGSDGVGCTGLAETLVATPDTSGPLFNGGRVSDKSQRCQI